MTTLYTILRQFKILKNYFFEYISFLPKPTGKRGRPRKKGNRLSPYNDFKFKKVGEYFVGSKMVITNLFKQPVYMTVTTKNLDVKKATEYF